ncbi:fumarate/nitrate reduction transcriptional regulator Fnr [Herbaspirillum frisingense]|uniref:fumarate/nitrate reduction transcriptional regulator Fnr n=1 Tax=Herbaspirillum frisingense TaxID=92645 RepID=UPI001F3E1BD5|nr:fumarate/nitrate reduction transcriptional regulator Fnr [Herbaspirillum frisingense]UIN19348.1 fumarate/nitrate reduction transcriptional regulator Fnr [Herbaspirillum frisingense]
MSSLPAPTSAHAPPPLTLHTLRASCSACSMHQLCLPMGLDQDDMQRLEQVINRRRKVKRDESLYRLNDKFDMLYAIRLGHFKTFQSNTNGGQQITGFQMAGELLGMDAIGAGHHLCEAVALEDSEVCEIPFSRLEDLFRDMPTLLRQFHRMMSLEISREQRVMLTLGSMTAQQKMAAFLLNLSSRYASRGYSTTRFQLRMTREEIGNYLGLAVESVSRLLTNFKKTGVIEVNHRDVELSDLPTLRAIALGNDPCA